MPLKDSAKPPRSSFVSAALRDVRVWHVAILVAVTAAVYGRTLFYDFVYDDFTIILENPWIRSFSHLGEVFTSSVSGFTDKSLIPNYYRPLIYVYYGLAYQLSGTSPLGYHLLNVVAHALVSIAVYALVRALPGTPGEREDGTLSVPLIAALLFAVHPIHSEAVDFIGACTELLFALFFTLSFVAYVRAAKVMSAAYAVSLACFLASALFKEPGITLPLVVVLYDLGFRREALWKPSTLARWLPYAAVGAIYFALRYQALGGLVPFKRHGELGVYRHLLNALALFSQYLQKLVVPTGQTIFHPFVPVTSILDPSCLIGAAVAIAFASAMYWGYRRQRQVYLGLVLIAVPLLPALYVSGVGESAFADRYVYLPSVGFTLLLALGARRLASTNVSARRLVAAAVVAITLVYSYATFQRNEVWRTDLTLWADAAEKAPDRQLPFKALGDYYLRVRNLDQAIELYRLALTKGPSEVNLLDALGIACAYKGDNAAAERSFREASALVPNDPRQYHNLGLVYARQRRYDDAIAAFTTALQLKPDYERAASSLRTVRQEKLMAGGRK